MTDDIYKGVSDQAAILIEKTLVKLTEAHNAISPRAGDPPGRLFFPNGIELIYLRFKVGQTVDLTFALAGDKAKYPSTALGTAGESVMLIGDDQSTKAVENPE